MSVPAYDPQPKPQAEPQSPPPEELEATSQAVLAAHEAHLHEAIASVQWERRGLLQRLTRT